MSTRLDRRRFGSLFTTGGNGEQVSRGHAKGIKELLLLMLNGTTFIFKIILEADHGKSIVTSLEVVSTRARVRSWQKGSSVQFNGLVKQSIKEL